MRHHRSAEPPFQYKAQGTEAVSLDENVLNCSGQGTLDREEIGARTAPAKQYRAVQEADQGGLMS
jgi:hypothetical protein